MTDLSLLIAGQMLLACAALACFCASTARYRSQLTKLGVATPIGRRALQATGWLLLLVVAIPGVAFLGLGGGLVALAGSASFAALVILMLANFRLLWLARAGIACAAAGALLWLAGGIAIA